jgi:two-component system cell cycle sensor histidine kinase/response regulator CckA
VISDLLGPRIALQICPNASRPWISSDLPQIIQVIVNLASNSRDAMPHGGQLVISTRDLDESPDAVPADRTKAEHWMTLQVRDTGAGMDKSTLAHAFEPFFTTKPVGTGTGLGLSTVYGVVRQSGGYVQVQSEIGKGTCVQIYFPAISAPQVSSLTFKPSNGNLLPDSATVLLVDDESALVHAIGEFLRECGYIVLDAFSVQDAVDLAKEHPGRIDVLITDVVMPDLSGPDLHRHILELQPDIQVLFMSGYAECLSHTKLPADARFLQKPFRFSVLLENLRQLHVRK